jgi:2-haloalkanoic acid dehalogenase type II
MRLTSFKVLTFDCYGTLIDWETGMIEAMKPLTQRLKEPVTRNQILEAHARQESRQQLDTPVMRYRDLLAVVYKRLAELWRVPVSWAECKAYGESIRNWPAFADSAPALRYLKQHYRLAILSNVDNESFAHSNERLGVPFDAVYTAEDIGSYKPDPRNFDYMIARLADHGFGKKDILHTAESLFHDHAPANGQSLASCWIHRRHEQGGYGATVNPGTLPHTDFRFTAMSEMVTAHEGELRG